VRRRSPPSSRGSSLSARRTTDLGLHGALGRTTLAERLRAAGCVFAEDEAQLLLTAATTPDELEQMVQQRVRGLPLEQVLGWAEFGGLRVAIEPGVFVPRRRTELILQQALRLAPPQPVVVELCCGSAALALAVASTLRDVQLYATDIDPVAVRCARRNLARLPEPAHILQGDLYEPLPQSLVGRVDLLLANAPYVPTDSIELMPPEARLYEPRMALDGGSDGLDLLRRIIAGARRWLAPNGRLLVETSRNQAAASVAACERHGLAARIVTSDELDATGVLAWPAAGSSRDADAGAGH
jgi:release factor glutamine methyltransferase